MAEEDRTRATLDRERWELLDRVVDLLEGPMVLLGMGWLGLLVLELTRGLSPPLETLSTGIWIVFLVDFAARLLIAPRKLRFLRTHWITLLSLALPALRVLRIARSFRALSTLRAARGTRLVRVLTSLNRGMRSLSDTMGRRGFGYVVALTIVVIFTGAAGMYALEQAVPGSALRDYGSAVWWTAMIMTTMGSDYWPQSSEGRILCFVLSLYAFAVFGYVTATLASFFIDHDARSADAPLAGHADVEALRREIAQLRAELAQSRVTGAPDQAH
jgi:voltage-gated potassium channel